MLDSQHGKEGSLTVRGDSAEGPCTVVVQGFKGVFSAEIQKMWPKEPDLVIGFDVDLYTCSWRGTLLYLLHLSQTLGPKIVFTFFMVHEPVYMLEIFANYLESFGDDIRQDCADSAHTKHWQKEWGSLIDSGAPLLDWSYRQYLPASGPLDCFNVLLDGAEGTGAGTAHNNPYSVGSANLPKGSRVNDHLLGFSYNCDVSQQQKQKNKNRLADAESFRHVRKCSRHPLLPLIADSCARFLRAGQTDPKTASYEDANLPMGRPLLARWSAGDYSRGISSYIQAETQVASRKAKAKSGALEAKELTMSKEMEESARSEMRIWRQGNYKPSPMPKVPAFGSAVAAQKQTLRSDSSVAKRGSTHLSRVKSEAHEDSYTDPRTGTTGLNPYNGPPPAPAHGSHGADKPIHVDKPVHTDPNDPYLAAHGVKTAKAVSHHAPPKEGGAKPQGHRTCCDPAVGIDSCCDAKAGVVAHDAQKERLRGSAAVAEQQPVDGARWQHHGETKVITSVSMEAAHNSERNIGGGIHGNIGDHTRHDSGAVRHDYTISGGTGRVTCCEPSLGIDSCCDTIQAPHGGHDTEVWCPSLEIGLRHLTLGLLCRRRRSDLPPGPTRSARACTRLPSAMYTWRQKGPEDTASTNTCTSTRSTRRLARATRGRQPSRAAGTRRGTRTRTPRRY